MLGETARQPILIDRPELAQDREDGQRHVGVVCVFPKAGRHPLFLGKTLDLVVQRASKKPVSQRIAHR